MLNIYKASAGSGKTFTLAKEYIRLLLGLTDEDGRLKLNPNPAGCHRSILAITFTNKATDEMKRRIIHELAVLAGAEPGWKKESPYAGDLMKEFGCTREALRKSSRLALQSVLYDFNFFHISTIDAFFQTILRTFAREAELTGNYELRLDEEDMVAEGMNRLITSLSTDPHSPATGKLTEEIIAYMIRNLESARSTSVLDKSSRIYTDLLKTLSRLHDETMAINLEAFRTYLSDPKRLADFRETLGKWRETVRSDARSASRSLLDLFEAQGAEFASGCITVAFLKAIIKESEGEPASQGTIDKVVDEGNDDAVLEALKGKFKKAGGSAAVNPAIIATARTIRHRMVTEEAIDAIEAYLFAMGLMRPVLEKMEEYRAENNALLISDTNSLLRTIIGDDDAPFVYERMGEWFNHFLIDEFQDTSQMQWSNLRTLVGEGIARGEDSLIIGDEKQCIYRFRNSDPTLLGHTVGEEFPGRVTVMGGGAASNSNWRSSAEVVAFNNDLFAAMAADYGMSHIYANVRQTIRRSDLPGFVKVRRLEGENPETETLTLLASDIRRQIEAGYRPADIAVLVRTNDEGQDIIDYLLGLQVADPGFPRFGIISDDAMSLASSPAVKIIVSALQAYADNETGYDTDIYSRARMDRMITRYESAIGHGSTPSEALRRAIDATGAAEVSSGVHRDWSLVSLVESIIASEVPVSMYDSQHGFISAFMDAVHDFCTRSVAADLRSLLRWWDDAGKKSCKVSAPADTMAIRVMTIHKSKGLEFPCVHIPVSSDRVVKFLSPEWVTSDVLEIPGADPECIPPLVLIKPYDALAAGPFGDYVTRRNDEQILDGLNNLYVAFTRAVSELCVHFHITVSSKGNDSNILTSGKMVNDALASAFGSGLAPGEEYISGSPTTPVEEQKKVTALDPHATVRMAPFYSVKRDDLWKGLKVADSDNDL